MEKKPTQQIFMRTYSKVLCWVPKSGKEKKKKVSVIYKFLTKILQQKDRANAVDAQMGE